MKSSIYTHPVTNIQGVCAVEYEGRGGMAAIRQHARTGRKIKPVISGYYPRFIQHDDRSQTQENCLLRRYRLQFQTRNHNSVSVPGEEMNIRHYTSTEDSLSPNNNLPYCRSTEADGTCTFRHLVTSVSEQQSHACWHYSSLSVLSIHVKENSLFRYALLAGLPASFHLHANNGTCHVPADRAKSHTRKFGYYLTQNTFRAHYKQQCVNAV